jgi:hypothetical protein
MSTSQENLQILAEAGCRSGRPSTAPAHGNLVIENLNEFAAAGVVSYTGGSVADFIIRESRPAAA